ncbi:MAG: hypothetical protein OXF85_00730 [Candidatus Saccharibacteria bacterium]|nr:hypothetical protein [Candidatus Saccharibacteria bacterium]
MALSESDLVSKIEKLLQKKYNTQLTFREVSAGYGIADLVIAPTITEDGTPMTRLPITHFGILQFYLNLGRGSYTFDKITELSPFIHPRNLRRYINFLVENEYLIKTEERYKKSRILENQQPIKKIIAIEAKLSDYKSGLVQAKRYQYFADQSYLAILRKAAKYIDASSIRQSGIGLILFDELTGTIQIKPGASVSIQQKIYKVFARETILSRMNTYASAF